MVTDRLMVSRDSAASERLRPWAPSSQLFKSFASVCTKLQIRLRTEACVLKRIESMYLYSFFFFLNNVQKNDMFLK